MDCPLLAMPTVHGKELKRPCPSVQTADTAAAWSGERRKAPSSYPDLLQWALQNGKSMHDYDAELGTDLVSHTRKNFVARLGLTTTYSGQGAGKFVVAEVWGDTCNAAG